MNQSFSHQGNRDLEWPLSVRDTAVALRMLLVLYLSRIDFTGVRVRLIRNMGGTLKTIAIFISTITLPCQHIDIPGSIPERLLNSQAEVSDRKVWEELELKVAGLVAKVVF